jgi:beta-barrel assembly-enhancing protease
MRRGFLFTISVLLIFCAGQVYGQFGRLTKALNKAKTFADLRISDEDEQALGQNISQRIRDIYGVQQDEAQTRYVTLVGKVLAERSSRPNLPWTFIILDSDSTNAFAAPGGYIHITRGALAVMKNEAELAGVLAHEITHVTEKHTIKGIQKMKGIEIAGDETSLSDNSALLDKVSEKATEALLQGFGRSEELEADEGGAELAAQCHYAPEGLEQFLQALQERYSSRQKRAGLFASHPETQERLDKLAKQIQKEELDEKGTALLPDRFQANIPYKLTAYTGTGEVAAGARGVAGGESESKSSKSEEKSDKKKGGGFMSKLSNPFGSGKKQETAEVTGSAAARGVETEVGTEQPGNPNVVVVKITPEELENFRKQGGLA